jgi:hypothetical protein
MADGRGVLPGVTDDARGALEGVPSVTANYRRGALGGVPVAQASNSVRANGSSSGVMGAAEGVNRWHDVLVKPVHNLALG